MLDLIFALLWLIIDKIYQQILVRDLKSLGMSNIDVWNNLILFVQSLESQVNAET
jgi:hypothetical protein